LEYILKVYIEIQISQSFRSTLKEFLKNNMWEIGLKNGKRYMKVLKQYLKNNCKG